MFPGWSGDPSCKWQDLASVIREDFVHLSGLAFGSCWRILGNTISRFIYCWAQFAYLAHVHVIMEYLEILGFLVQK